MPVNEFNSVPADRRQQVVAGFIECHNADAGPGGRLRDDSEEGLNKSMLDFSDHKIQVSRSLTNNWINRI
jgi:hypothetical protein